MNNVRLSQRTLTVVEITDTGLNWSEVNKMSKSIGWRVWLWWVPFILMFMRWQTVLAPVGTPSAMTTIGGNSNPIYQYKLLAGKVYYLGPEPAPEY